MTRLETAAIACVACGTESKQTILWSSNTLGGLPDLDGRPRAMLRDTMYLWVQRCPGCGYCAMDLSQDHEYDLPVAPIHGHEGIWAAPAALPSGSATPPVSSERREFLGTVVRSVRYREQLNDPEFPGLANSFLCQSLVDEADGRHVDAAFGALHAAWVCDDARAGPQATAARKRAAKLIQEAPQGRQAFGIRLRSSAALLTDVLRRSGEFESAAAECQRGLSAEPDQFLRNLLAFQSELIKQRDAAAHSLVEAIQLSQEARGVPAGGPTEGRKEGWWRFWRRT